MLKLGKYSIGVGDRFGHEAQAQLSAIFAAKQNGIDIVPIWNKSNREHTIIGTEPKDVRIEVENAVKATSYSGEYHVDADHISLKNVDWFMSSSDFFTLDVADFTGKPAADDDIRSFLKRHAALINCPLQIPGISAKMKITESEARSIAEKFLLAIQEAGKLYRHIEQAKNGKENFIVEVSMDETDLPQRPKDMLLILAAIADEEIPAQTIAPKFSGRFNKGVDYVGDIALFEQEFNDDLAVIQFAVKTFNLPENLKLSIHSGSDKFSLYPIMNRGMRRFNAGLHLKTAGTTWLEEIIGLAEADGDGLKLAQQIYQDAYGRFDELRKPYATVIDIDWNALPTPNAVNAWTAQQFTNALRHDEKCPAYNPNFRQMLHVAFKVAAELGNDYLNAIAIHADCVAKNVSANLLERHIKPLFYPQN